MRYIILLIFVMLCGFRSYAHEPDLAYFKILQKEKFVEVIAEFPWTIRDALMKFDPALRNATSKQQFLKSFVLYMDANFILKDYQGKKLKMKTWEEQPNTGSGHSHQSVFFFTYDGNQVKEIENTLLFALNKNQVNVHEITLGTTVQMFSTRASRSLILLTEKQQQPAINIAMWVVFVVVVLIGAAFLYRHKRIIRKWQVS